MTAIVSLNTTSALPPRPTQHQFVDLVKLAQKTDQSIYTAKQFQEMPNQFNAQTPNYLNLVTSPFVIAKHLYTLATKKIEATFVRNDLKSQISIHLLNFISVSLKVCLVLSFFGILTAEVTLLSPMIISLAAISSLIGICQNTYHLIQQNKFLSHFNFDCLDCIIRLQRKLKTNNTKNIQSHINKLLTHLYSTDIGNSEWIEKLEQFNTKKTLSKGELKNIQAIVNNIQHAFLLSFFNKIKEKYFSLTNVEKEDQLKKALKLFDKQPFNQALEKSVNLVKSTFLRKKFNLSAKIHVKQTLATIYSINEVIQRLSQERPEQEDLHIATRLAKKIHTNAKTKKSVLISNIALYGINLAVSSLGYFFPFSLIATVSIIGISSIISSINHIDIQSVLESTHKSRDLYNCLPPWVHYIHKKICSK